MRWREFPPSLRETPLPSRPVLGTTASSLLPVQLQFSVQFFQGWDLFSQVIPPVLDDFSVPLFQVQQIFPHQVRRFPAEALLRQVLPFPDHLPEFLLQNRQLVQRMTGLLQGGVEDSFRLLKPQFPRFAPPAPGSGQRGVPPPGCLST